MVIVKHLKQVVKVNNIKNYSKLRKKDLQTVLRNSLPRDIYFKEYEVIQKRNREEAIKN